MTKLELKRSKSVDDLTITQPVPSQSVQQLQEQLTSLQQRLQELFPEQTEAKPSELLELLITKHNELTDYTLELRLENLKDFGKYRAELKAVENDFTEQIQTDQSEISELEKRVNLLTKERTRLQRDKSLVELKLINLELGENNNNFDWWIDYTPWLSLILVSWLSVWLLSKNIPRNTQ